MWPCVAGLFFPDLSKEILIFKYSSPEVQKEWPDVDHEGGLSLVTSEIISPVTKRRIPDDLIPK